MKIKDLRTVLNSIQNNIIISFCIITVIFCGVWLITKYEYDKKGAASSQQELYTSINLFKSIISEKLSIIADSQIFIDYVNSGTASRNEMSLPFLTEVSQLDVPSIIGMKLNDTNGDLLFQSGNESRDNTTLKLCYLNSTLNNQYGNCRYYWTLYFDKNKLLNALQKINTHIKNCPHCESVMLLGGPNFGNFPVEKTSVLKTQLTIQSDNIIYNYLFYIFITMPAALVAWIILKTKSIFKKNISNPLVEIAQQLKSGVLPSDQGYVEEIRYLMDQINLYYTIKDKIEITKIAAQAAHDIRSPLLTLDIAMKNLKNLPENHRKILHNVANRINDIANNLLIQYRSPKKDLPQESLKKIFISSVLAATISEKRMQYSHLPIIFKLEINERGRGLFALIDEIDFKRVLSNLINNAVEAIKSSGIVKIKLINYATTTRIEISDNGVGIPPEVLPKVLRGGISIGKENGSGLGLSHALKCAETWGGNIDIQSRLNNGTTVGINLPFSDAADWFCSSLVLTKESGIVVLDDESFIHKQWDLRFKQFFSEEQELLINHFYNPDRLIEHTKANGLDNIVFLIDYDLGRNFITGIELINNLKASEQAVLVTNRYDDIEVQNICLQSGMKIIPKDFVNYIPISWDTSTH
jgi:signal transduction histidine kinase